MHVVLDLEMNPVKNKNNICGYEVIEIGAVMLDEELQKTGEFHQYVKPETNTIVRRITDLTGITNEMVADAQNFNYVMNEFLEWIGSNPVTIYSWSNTDFYQFKRESKLKQYSDDRLEVLYKDWVNLQKEYKNMIGYDQDVSLKKAIDSVGISFTGKIHTALGDAETTANLLCLMKDEKQFDKKIKPVKDLFTETKSGYSLGELYADIFKNTILAECS